MQDASRFPETAAGGISPGLRRGPPEPLDGIIGARLGRIDAVVMVFSVDIQSAATSL
jgi:hypothetical protein